MPVSPEKINNTPVVFSIFNILNILGICKYLIFNNLLSNYTFFDTLTAMDKNKSPSGSTTRGKFCSALP